MLATFCLRLACGLAAALLFLSPAQVNPRFYRVQFLTILGLIAVAVVDVRHTADIGLWLVLIGSMSLAFAGSFVWWLEGAPAGRTVIGLTVLTLLIGLGVMAFAAHPGRVGIWWLMNDLSAAAVLGAATSAMLMGHSYLTAPAMSITPLRRLLVALFIALGARILVAAMGLGFWTASHSLLNLKDITVLWLPVRWGVGFVVPLVLTWMAWETAKIRSTQSATGILYVVVICCFLGELTSQLLQQSGYVL
ncbi:MAG: hypothetical protein ACK4RK_14045 [Gemmataceae bacterium]